MIILFSFLLILVVSKEVLYFNEELLVIISFLSFLVVVSSAIGNLVGASLDASIREVTEGVSSKISDYMRALELNRGVLLNQLSISSACPSLAVASLEPVFEEPVLLKVGTLNKLLNVTMARSLVENNQVFSYEPAFPSLVLEPKTEMQPEVLANARSSISDTCFVALPADAFVLTVLNSLLVVSLR